MPRDNDKDNASRGRRDRPQRNKRDPGKRDPGKRDSAKRDPGKRGFGERRAAAHGAEKKFAKRGFGGKGGDKGRDMGRDRGADHGGDRDRPRSRDDREQRPFRRRDDRDGPRRDGDRPRGARFDRDDRGTGRFQKRGEGRGRDFDRRDRDRSDEKPWHEKSSHEKSWHEKPWRKHEDRRRDDRGRDDRPRFSREREERSGDERQFRERPKFDRPRERREDRPKFDRPRERHEGRSDWHEHPRSDKRARDRFADRPRRDNEDDGKIFAKRPAFGGRGAYRERKPEFDRRRPREEARPENQRPKKTGERIAKVLARAGLASRRDAEEWVVQGRVTVNGRVINSPALDVTASDVIAVDGKPLPPRERTRLFLYHKPRGLMTTHADPEGRPTVFDHLPEDLPRLISVGRLDFNTEGLLLLTNDGGLARVLELPDTGWLRRYRVRAHGEVTQAQLDQLRSGIEVDGVKYGPIDATLERDQGANVWLVFAIREGKNREVRNVLSHLGLEVNRLIRISYGPFQLGELGEGEADEVKTRVLREQLGEKVIAQAGADFAPAEPHSGGDEEGAAPRGKKPFKPAGRSALVADRKGRRVLVQRSGSAEARARNEAEAGGYGVPRRPKRGYHGKRDLRPKDESRDEPRDE
jgi:23S rRNA pseudouridine2605 synthase